MSKTEYKTVCGNRFRFTEYDDITEIATFIAAHDLFHDASIEHIEHTAEHTTISVRHYADNEDTVHRLRFTGNVALIMDLDLLLRFIYEIELSVKDRIQASFEGTGIIVKSDKLTLITQEHLN